MILFASQFRLEREMLEPLSRALPTVLGFPPCGISVLREPTIGAVIPDLLVAVWPDEHRAFRGTRLSRLQFEILALLVSQAGATVSEVAQALNAQEATVRPALRLLERSGFVTGCSSEMVTPTAAALGDKVEITAIEAKLTRWRIALEQAHSYRTFADRSYVALDGNRVRVNETMVDAFSSKGVGLLLQFGTVLMECVIAESKKPVSGDRFSAIGKLSRL